MVFDDLLAPQALADGERFVETPPARARIEAGGGPLAAQPARANADFGAPAREPIERLHGARSHEGMPQAQQVDVRAEPDARRLAREKAQVGEGVEDRRRRRHRRQVFARMRRAGHLEREHEMLGHPDGFEAETLGLERGLDVKGGIQTRERDAEFHGFARLRLAARPLRGLAVRAERSSSREALRGLEIDREIERLEAAAQHDPVVPARALRRHVLVEHVLANLLRVALERIAPAAAAAETRTRRPHPPRAAPGSRCA